MLQLNRTLAGQGAYINMAKRGVLHQAAFQACDELDGAKDGVISNVKGCLETFDPSTAMIDGKPLHCAGGDDAGDTCLSDAQIAALKKVSSPFAFNFPLDGGQKEFPGYNILIADLGNANPSPYAPIVASLTIGTSAATSPPAETSSFSSKLGDLFVRYAITGDLEFNPLALNPSNPDPYAHRIRELASMDLTDEDLSAFANRGGKLLIMQGTEDMLVSTRSTEAYVGQLKDRMGAGKVDSFLRYYEVPGYGHLFSTVFNASWDHLTALENWVEHSTDPAEHEVVTDTSGVPGRTRPLCRYPNFPKYKGTGDLRNATSFVCSAN